MFEAIVALIGAVVGVVGGAIKSGSERYLAKSAEYEANIQAQRDKEKALYNVYGNQANARTIIVVVGFLFIIFMIYLQSKKK